MTDVTDLVSIVFSGLSALVIDDVEDAGEVICVRARTRDVAVACPGCGAPTARVHGYYERTAADVPVDGRRVLVRVKVRRLRCPVPGCPRQTFREQVPGVLDRYQRRTTRLTGQVRAVVRELAGRAGARLLPALGILASRHTALRVLLRIPLPEMTVPRVTRDRPIRGSRRPVRNVGQRALGGRFGTSACSYLGSHDNVRNVAMVPVIPSMPAVTAPRARLPSDATDASATSRPATMARDVINAR
jgi:hypothetical protein